MALPSTQYPKYRSGPSTQPLGHLCYVFKLCWLKSRKIEFKLFIYNSVISFLALKTIQIDILYSFLCSLFQKLW